MTVFGVPFGANISHQGEKLKAGNPTSAAVGIFGALLKRSLAVTRYALIPPDRTCIKLVGPVHTRSMCPANKSCMAGASPLGKEPIGIAYRFPSETEPQKRASSRSRFRVTPYLDLPSTTRLTPASLFPALFFSRTAAPGGGPSH